MFDVTEQLGPDNATQIYARISERLAGDDYRPRALFDRFNISVLATTDGALDPLDHHQTIAESGWNGKIIPTYRPDAVIDPETAGFVQNLRKLGQITGQDTATWAGYLAAHRERRAFFKSHGATATDHGHLTARTLNLPDDQAAVLFARCLNDPTAKDADAFRAQMLTEMARISVQDSMTMQVHAGSVRNHSPWVLQKYGRDKDFDIPQSTDYVHALRPMLDAVGLEPGLNIILFTLDEAAYSRELAPLAGIYPSLTLGPAWWFFDSAEEISAAHRGNCGYLQHRRVQ